MPGPKIHREHPLPGVDLKDLVCQPRDFQLGTSASPVSVEYLDSPDAVSTPLFNTFCVLLILKVSYSGSRNANDSNAGGYSKSAASKPFDRHFTAMCLHSRSGRNGVMILVGTGNNERKMFHPYVDGRDNKDGFGPGSVIIVCNPRPIAEAFGGDSERRIPIINFDGGLILVDQTVRTLKFSPIPCLKNSQRLSGFMFPEATVELLHLSVVNSNCKGYLCDSAESKGEVGDKNVCACYKHISENSQHIAVLKLKVTPNLVGAVYEGDVILPDYFASRSFTEFVMKGGFPNVDCSNLSSAKMHKLSNAFLNTFACGNSKKKWSVSGWYRLGQRDDAANAADSESGSRKYVKKVESSSLLYHLSSIRYNGPSDDISEHFIDGHSLVLDEDSEQNKRQRTENGVAPVTADELSN